MTEKTTVKTKRILVALDSSARGKAALEAAVRLAITTSAELLQGLFVEDEDLLRLAALPFAREVDFTSASPRQLRSANMERALRSAAQKTEQVFVDALQQRNLRWTFRIVRGTVTGASLAAAVDVDLLVIGQQGRCSKIMSGDFLPRRNLQKHRVVALFDGSPSAFRAIELGSRLAESNSGKLTVLVLPGRETQGAETCRAWLKQQGIRADVDQTLAPSGEAITYCVRRCAPGLLLINRDSEFLDDSMISQIVDEFECPLILC